jgi:hypothetical protein
MTGGSNLYAAMPPMHIIVMRAGANDWGEPDGHIPLEGGNKGVGPKIQELGDEVCPLWPVTLLTEIKTHQKSLSPPCCVSGLHTPFPPATLISRLVVKARAEQTTSSHLLLEPYEASRPFAETSHDMSNPPLTPFGSALAGALGACFSNAYVCSTLLIIAFGAIRCMTLTLQRCVPP